MSFTIADVLLEVRDQISDTMVPYRYSDASMIRKINQVISRMAILRPDLFTTIATISCAAGGLQTAPVDSLRIMDVLGNNTGAAVKEVSQDVLDMMIPTWETLPPGPAINWMRYPRDQNRFYVAPAATAGLALTISYARSPATLALDDIVPLQDAYKPTVIDGSVWIMESIDAENVESGRAKMFQDSFNSMLSAGLTARRLTDTSSAALPRDEVIQ